MSTPTKTSDLASHLKIPIRTLQRHLSRHARHVGATKAGSRGWVLSQDSLELLEMVRDLYNSGRSEAEVESALERSSGPDPEIRVTCATVAPRTGPEREDYQQSIDALESEMESLRDEVGDLKAANLELESKVDSLEDIVDDLKTALETLEQERLEERSELELLRDQVDGMERSQDETMKAHNIALHEAEILFERLEKALVKLPGGVA